MKKYVVGVVLAILSTGALATDYGRWFCESCDLKSQGVDAAVTGEISAFLRGNLITDRWKPNDTITVCDGATCQKVVWRTSAWYTLGLPTKDSGGSYRNGSSGLTVTSQGPDTDYYEVSVRGHWEWWDYYANGRYIGSSEREYIIDSVEITYTKGTKVLVP